MSGHSKWASIKHKKAVVDAKKGKAFTLVGKMIAVAARGGADPSMNFALRLAIDKAKSVNMPKDNIDRAIKKGSGQLKGEAFVEITYEGYGPGKVALIINGATDNRNRAASDIRSSLTKAGGSLGASGSVAWMFEKRGQIIIEPKGKDIDEITLSAIDAGASDVDEDEGKVFIYTEPSELKSVKDSLEKEGLVTEEASLENIPTTETAVTDKDTAEKLLKLIDILEDLEDVVSVDTNADIQVEL